MMCLLLLSSVIIVLCLFHPHISTYVKQLQTGGGLVFSSIDGDISDGNPESWSKRPNVGGSTFMRRPQFRGRGNDQFEPLTFYGQIPLDYETHRSYKGDVINPESIPTKNPVCDLGCCPSSHSCDHGCICYGRDRQGGTLYGDTSSYNRE